MRKSLVLLCLAGTIACGSSPTTPEPESSSVPADFDPGARCFDLHITGVVAPDVRLPRLIELTNRATPYTLEAGSRAVLEPAGGEPRAPISWWRPIGETSLELVLGGGFTGYTFSLTRDGDAWVGQGKYCADFGVEPAPDELGLRLTPRGCP